MISLERNNEQYLSRPDLLLHTSIISLHNIITNEQHSVIYLLRLVTYMNVQHLLLHELVFFTDTVVLSGDIYERIHWCCYTLLCH